MERPVKEYTRIDVVPPEELRELVAQDELRSRRYSSPPGYGGKFKREKRADKKDERQARKRNRRFRKAFCK